LQTKAIASGSEFIDEDTTANKVVEQLVVDDEEEDKENEDEDVEMVSDEEADEETEEDDGTFDPHDTNILGRHGTGTHTHAAKILGRAKRTKPFKILFVGNSFTYGPPPFDRVDQMSLNNLPRFFKLIAESLGQPVLQQEDTLGGCSLYAAHRPSIHPESRNCSDPLLACQTVDTGCLKDKPNCTPRVHPSMACSTASDISIPSAQWHPCPQLFGRQQFGSWDVVVLQDQSALPTVKGARELYLYPAVEEFVQAAKLQGGKHKKAPLIASFMSWAYFNSTNGNPCPSWSKPGCFPLGTMNELAECASNTKYLATAYNYECQAYSLARAYASLLNHGADVFIPAGLANIAARGAQEIPADCKAAIDSEYAEPFPFADLDLPLKANPEDARWTESQAHKLFRDLGHVKLNREGHNQYCNDGAGNGCTHDHHASAISMYLNALVFYTVLLKKSPIGAGFPNGQTVDGMLMPVVDEEDAKAMQRIVHDVILPHLSRWWKK
jgi:hypothetical protein